MFPAKKHILLKFVSPYGQVPTKDTYFFCAQQFSSPVIPQHDP